jgi:hypothetical protein
MTIESSEPAESTSQELRGVVDSGAESFAVDGLVEAAETAETKGDETPAKEEKPAGEKEGKEKPSEEKPGKEKPGEEKPPAEPLEEELPKGIKKRLATVTRKRHDAERREAATAEKNQKLLDKIKTMEHPGEAGKEPHLDDFDTEAEYQDAIIEWRTDQKIAERDAAQKVKDEKDLQKEQDAKTEKREENFRAELEKGVEKYEDFEDVIEDLNITGDMIHILESLPNVPEMVYELGSNPETVTEIVDLPFLEAAYRMKEISDGLKGKKATKAPKPIKPVSTTGGVIKSPENMTMKEYTAYRDKQDAEKRGQLG